MSERRIFDIATKSINISILAMDRIQDNYEFIDKKIREQEQKGECTPLLYELRGRIEGVYELIDNEYKFLFKQYSQYVDERQS